jgi:hypothetical protein
MTGLVSQGSQSLALGLAKAAASQFNEFVRSRALAFWAKPATCVFVFASHVLLASAIITRKEPPVVSIDRYTAAGSESQRVRIATLRLPTFPRMRAVALISGISQTGRCLTPL